MKRVGKQRRAEDRTDLLSSLPDLELFDLVICNVIALVDVELVDAEAGKIRAAAEHQGQGGGAEDRAHGCGDAAKRRSETIS